jgi:hypothetical protein
MVTWMHGGHGDIGNHIEGLGFIMHKGISMNMQIEIRILVGTFITHTINIEACLISRVAFIL